VLDLADGVCTRALHLMPSTRAEVWVTYRNASGIPDNPPPGASAILRSEAVWSGPEGEIWPAIDLADVSFRHDPPQTSLFAASGPSSARASARSLSAALRSTNAAVPSDPTCTPLAPGHMRRIFFGSPPQSPYGLGLGYEEVDEQGTPVPGTFMDITPFDPSSPTVCLPLGPGNHPTIERWQLINISRADHNFHIHQAHFSVLSQAAVAGTALPETLQQQAVIVDSVPLLHAEGACASVADWRSGACAVQPAVVEITFSIAGDFVYHCHISSHEDAGMMAVIRVRPDAAPQSRSFMDRVLYAMSFPSTGPTQPLQPRIGGIMCRSKRPAPNAWQRAR